MSVCRKPATVIYSAWHHGRITHTVTACEQHADRGRRRADQLGTITGSHAPVEGTVCGVLTEVAWVDPAQTFRRTA